MLGQVEEGVGREGLGEGANELWTEQLVQEARAAPFNLVLVLAYHSQLRREGSGKVD